MKLSTRIAAAAAALLSCNHAARAQLAQGGQPLGLDRPFSTSAPVLVVPPPDVEAYRAEDEVRGHRPLRYGALVDVAADLSDGAWTTFPDGSRAWRLAVVSPGARSVALEFSRFDLPPGARVYVYETGVDTVLGAYTAENRHADGGFVFEPFAGERLTLEIDLPAGVPDPLVELRALIHDYRGVFALMSGSDSVGGNPGDECLIDVNCPQGDPFPQQKRATLRTLSDGQLCSGALLNNTAGDGTGYVLTADHCGTTSQCVFLFNYQTSGCGSGTAPTDQTVSGCTPLATSATWDSRLLRIDSVIPAPYQPFFAGWSRSTANPTLAIVMGHPSGGPKKIAIDSDGAFLQDLLGSSYWAMTWSEGYVQPYSSGGPMFDEAGRVRGPAVLAQFFEGSCFQNVWASRFDRFWTANALAQWLDPLGTGATAIDGFDPSACGPVQNVCITTPNSVGAGAVMSWSGSPSHLANDLHLMTSGCPPGVLGIYFCGTSQALVPVGNGFRCIANPATRLAVVQADGSGVADHDLDVTGTPIDPGETWYFQLWYRDPAAGGANFDLSDALEVPFCD